ncbi:MAG: thioredoxin domain-containing protein [Gammaproteobacteria bacterium]|nr:MAG: thioredoxin domain-containing protein [Gammaproteobacteria bacterium]
MTGADDAAQPRSSGGWRLAGAGSRYLREHATNPVAWHPWGEEALATARRENRPILLSIGYSACHWCHVMAAESFADEDTAALMNREFVSIKVDREERPDLDRLYQAAQQLITRRGGGWPLTVFLTPDELTPFYGGTYFPPEPRGGLPAFREVLAGIATFYRERPEEVREQGRAVADVLPRLEPELPLAATSLDSTPLDAVRQILAEGFDAEHGGFGEAPKFPHATSLNRLLRHWRSGAAGEAPDVQALFMASLSLTRMAEGGLFDHLGGGFFRYATDRAWQIPHFEKMLYDNALLLGLYADIWRASGDERWRGVARAVAAWVIRDMQGPEGGYYSTLDADSDGDEGGHYLWTREEIGATLDPEQAALVETAWGLDGPANFSGRWHLVQAVAPSQLARQFEQPVSRVTAALERARARLLAARQQRPQPARDEKILTGWNGLMITAMARAARAVDLPEAGESAFRAMRCLRDTLWQDGRLCAAWTDGRTPTPAWLDDHACLLEAALALLELRWDDDLLAFAQALAEQLLARFEDVERGGFYFTAKEHDTPLHRHRQFADEATPSGNAVAALALQRLGLLLGEPRYLQAAERTVRAAWQALVDFPQAHCRLLDALEELLMPPEIVILRGEEAAVATMLDVATAVYAPRRLVFHIPPSAQGLPPALAAKAPAGDAVAYVCIGTHCTAPLADPAALAGALNAADGA